MNESCFGKYLCFAAICCQTLLIQCLSELNIQADPGSGWVFRLHCFLNVLFCKKSSSVKMQAEQVKPGKHPLGSRKQSDYFAKVSTNSVTTLGKLKLHFKDSIKTLSPTIHFKMRIAHQFRISFAFVFKQSRASFYNDTM